MTSAGVFGFNNKNYTVDDPEDILSAVYDKTTSSCKLITTTTSIEENDFIEIEVGRHKSGSSLDPTNSLVPGGNFVRKSPRCGLSQPFSYLFFYILASRKALSLAFWDVFPQRSPTRNGEK